MALGLTADAAWAWTYATLAGDATLTTDLGGAYIYRELAPKNAPDRYLLVRVLPGPSELGLGTTHVLDNVLLRITTVSKNKPPSSTKTARLRVYALLHGKKGGVADGTVLACVKSMDLPVLMEHDGEDVYWHPGTEFRLAVQ